MKEGRKSAVRVLESASMAGEWMCDNAKKGEKLKVVKREGERTRCQNYCSASKFCPYFNKGD